MVAILVGVAAAGFVRLVFATRHIDAKISFVTEFMEKFQQYIQSDGRDGESYT